MIYEGNGAEYVRDWSIGVLVKRILRVLITLLDETAPESFLVRGGHVVQLRTCQVRGWLGLNIPYGRIRGKGCWIPKELRAPVLFSLPEYAIYLWSML